MGEVVGGVWLLGVDCRMCVVMEKPVLERLVIFFSAREKKKGEE